MRFIKRSAILMALLVLSLPGCGGGGGGGGGSGAVVITASTNTIIAASAAVSTVSIAGVSGPIICGIDLRVTYPNGTTFVNGVPSGVTPVGTSFIPVDIRLLEADVTVLNGNLNGFGSGEIAKINYTTVPIGSVSTNFGVSVLKVFDCNGLQIQ